VFVKETKWYNQPMSGHSKWSTIKRQKEVTDIKRGQIFTKLARAITMAVREGSGVNDINSNFKLRIAVEKAKEVNMPKENIKRAIDKGKGKAGDGDMFESIVYEGYGPSGVAFIIETATDNKARTGSQVKHILEKSGGHLGGSGSVMFQFEHQGFLFIPKGSLTEDQVLEKVVESGAIDMIPTTDGFEIFTHRDDLHKIKEVLTANGFTISSAELFFRPKITVPLSESSQQKVFVCIEELEELDDVQKVYTNEEVPE
jgi:YebC/PmpR family DNA-binding regulatory protein